MRTRVVDREAPQEWSTKTQNGAFWVSVSISTKINEQLFCFQSHKYKFDAPVIVEAL